MENIKKKIIEQIKSKNEIKIITHNDADGICSAILAYKLVKKINPTCLVKFKVTTPTSIVKEKETGKFKIITDIMPTHLLNKYLSNYIIVFDHHILENKPVDEKLLLVHPSLLGYSNYCPASRLIYEFFKKELNDFDYIAVIGTIGDSGIEFWKKKLSKVIKKYKTSEEELNELAYILGSIKVLKGNRGVLRAILQLKDVSNFNEFFIEVSKFKKIKEKVDRMIKREIERFYKEKEEIDDIWIYEIKSKRSIGSIVSSIISYENKNKTIFIYKKGVFYYTINLRRSDGKLNLNEIVKKALNGLRGNGGGHKEAAGAKVFENDFELFKERFIELANQ